MPITSYRDLEVWQLSMALARRVFAATELLPWPHRYEMGGQMRKAALSAPSNIAEGFRQGARGAYLRHIRIAAGSTAELATQAQLATELQLWAAETGAEVHALAERTGQMLSALIRSLQVGHHGTRRR